ncbi:centromere protein L [Python bivittatus]|uniref:Centromere protein L n=1 Tax=Python bivittatus TaxID=176946 RepID=A0A9F2QUB7_PYTBI|nr:centromere protein L [Python bivittatus]
MSSRLLLKARHHRRDASTSNSRRMKTVGGVTADCGVNFTNTTYLSRGVLSLRKRKLFGQTPAKIMISQNPDLQENADHQIQFILSKQWTLYSVTPLYKFSYGRLQEYSKQLSCVITAQKEKRFMLEDETDLMFKAKFSSFSILKTIGKKQAAVLTEIIQRPQMVDEDEEEEQEGKVVWMGCFCCTCASDFVETVTEDFTCLPLFLVNGPKGFSNIVETWFQQTFDCYFSPLHISPIHLAWMAAIWSGCSMDHYKLATELTFSVPCLPYPLDISYAIHPEDAKALWDSIHSIQGEVKQEEVQLFMDSLYKHFHRHFKIYLSAARLVKVSTSVAFVHSLGKMKIHHAQYLMGVLSLLTELALSKIL